MGNKGSFPGGKAAGAWSWPLALIKCRGQECLELYFHSPNTPSWRGAQLKKHRDNFTFAFTFIYIYTHTHIHIHTYTHTLMYALNRVLMISVKIV
jgi:hypothetical protein